MASMLSRSLPRAALVSLLVASGALALAGVLPRGSERFWLLVPLAGALWLGPRAWPAMGLLYLGLVGACAIAGAWLTRLSFPGLWRVPWQEALVGGWYLLGCALLAWAPWASLRELLYRRYRDRPGAYLPQILPTLAVFPLLPVVLGSLFVHRLKVPDLVRPAQAEEVTLRTEDGLSLQAWFLPAQEGPSTRTVAIFHGLGANRSMFLPFRELGEVLSANVLMVDLRGHGESDGHTVSFGCWEELDVRASIEWLREERPEQARQVIGVGISLGTAGLIRAAAQLEPPLDGLLLDSAFAAPAELATDVLKLFPAPLRPGLAAIGLPVASLEAGCWLPDVRPIDELPHVRAPVLLVHARGDPLIPAEHSMRLYERAVEPKSLWISETSGHGLALIEARAPYLERVRQLFLR
jgi:pimeloyl-ACP methyl ester carboxylesterase